MYFLSIGSFEELDIPNTISVYATLQANDKEHAEEILKEKGITIQFDEIIQL